MPSTSTRGIFVSKLGLCGDVDDNFVDGMREKVGWRTARRMNTSRESYVCIVCFDIIFMVLAFVVACTYITRLLINK